MASKESSDRIGYVVGVKILDIEKRNKIGPKHYVYVIQVTWANPSNLFIIYRRYAQFFDLQCKLLDLFGETPSESNGNVQTRQIPFLPGKIILGRSQIRQIALERKQGLDEYCQTLISLPDHISRSHPILEFFHPSSTDVQKSIVPAAQEKTSADKSSLVISAPSKLENYRCLADFTATEKIEMSLKRNNIVQVLQKHPNGWWFVQSGDQTGFVPGSYLEPSELKRGAREGKTIEKSLNEPYVVNTTYHGKGKDELSLEQGSFVTVIEKSLTGWWKVKFNNTIGQYPAVHLTSCDGRYTPENGIDDAPRVTSKKQVPNNANNSDSDGEDDYHLDPSKASKPELYYAHRDFNDDPADCLSFKRGDVIEVHEKHSSGWWFGRLIKGNAILSWVPASHLQKEPIVDNIIKNNNTQSLHKPPARLLEKFPNPSVNQQEKVKTTTTNMPKSFQSSSSNNNLDSSTVIKKSQSIETTTAQKSSPTTNSTPFRPINNKQDTTTVAKSSPITSSTAFRPINNKQETSTAQKTPPITTSTPFRPVNDKHPVNDKQETTTAQKNFPISTSSSTSSRPVNDKQETAAVNKSSTVSTATSFRPVNNKQETTTIPKSSSITTSSAFRPLNNKQETTTVPKSSPATTSTPIRSANAKPGPTQNSVKDLIGRYKDK